MAWGCAKAGPGRAKSEIRRPKAERRPKSEVRIQGRLWGVEAHRLESCSDFGFRVSGFGFEGGRTISLFNPRDIKAALCDGLEGKPLDGGLGPGAE